MAWRVRREEEIANKEVTIELVEVRIEYEIAEHVDID